MFSPIQKANPMDNELTIGDSYYIRTLSFNYAGRLAAVHHDVLVLTHASWIPEDDRFHVTLSRGTFREVEPYPSEARVLVNRAVIVDMTAFPFQLPTQPK